MVYEPLLEMSCEQEVLLEWMRSMERPGNHLKKVAAALAHHELEAELETMQPGISGSMDATNCGLNPC